MKVLSLFDGMACGMLAMQAVGIEVDRYVAFEIDKYATKTSSLNFPMIEHRGDVSHADFTEFLGFDFVFAGFPCTKFSIAQKNDRETKPYSGEGWLLFEQAWRAVCEAKPKYFIFENNKSMANAVRQEISKIVGFDPDCINSSLLSGQNRLRLYWVGKQNSDGTYSKVRVCQPEYQGILVRDILDRVGSNDASDVGEAIAKVAVPLRIGTYPNGAKNKAHDSQQYRIYSTDGKSVNLCGNGGGMGAKTGLYAVPCKVGEIGNGGQGNRIYSIDGKSISQTATSGGIGSNTGLYAIPVEFDGVIPIKAISGADEKTFPVHQVEDGVITINGEKCPVKLADGFYIIRKLTVSECKRLQTVPEWYVFPVSDSQAYKMLGNGWTVVVIAHLIRATQANELEDEQLNLFEGERTTNVF